MKIRGQEYEDDLDQVADEIDEGLDPLDIDELDAGGDDGGDNDGMSRKERRAQRGRDWDGDGSALREELSKRDQEIAELRGRFDQMSRMPPQQAPQQSQQDVERQVNQRFKELEDAEERAAMHLVNLEGKASQAEIEDAKENYRKAKRENQMFTSAVANARMCPPPPPPHQVELQKRQARWNEEHKDVLSNEHARAIANAELAKLRTGQDWVPSDAEVKRATDIARRTLKLGATEVEPTEHQKRATSGYPSSGSARGKQAPRASTEDQRRQAVDWYDLVVAPHVKKPARSDAEKVRVWEKHVLGSGDGD